MLKKIFNWGSDEEESKPTEKEEEQTAETEADNLFTRLKKGLSKTREGFIAEIEGLFKGYASINDELFEELEEILIQADVGVHTTMKLVDDLKERAEEQKIKDPTRLTEILKEEIRAILKTEQTEATSDKPTVLMVVGVNGVGKTTTIGKIAQRAKNSGKDVLLAAGDTFRAGAIQQLESWGEKVGVEVIAHQEGADSAAVAYDAVEAAKSRDTDLLIVDTAGRLHTQDNLMDELKKVREVIDSQVGREMQVETLLVLDATTGQNAVSQAEKFNQAVDLDGLVMTKLDGTAKGGVIISVKEEIEVPIKLIGVGEDLEDLQDFEAETFIKALFEEGELTA